MDQSTFVAALLDSGRPPPDGLQGPDHRPAGKRFDVYRNNVAVSLTEALETGFPVVAKLVGPEFFAAMAGVFIRQHPPESPLLFRYGAAFPGFLEGFDPAAGLPYLPDMARLELALRQAYHAADTTPFDPARLAALPPDRLLATSFRFAPAVAVVSSRWPIHAIWRANTTTDAPPVGASAETVLVTRPEFDPVITNLDPAQAALITALRAGRPLGSALDAATSVSPDFDLSQTLGLLLAQQAITDLDERPQS